MNVALFACVAVPADVSQCGSDAVIMCEWYRILFHHRQIDGQQGFRRVRFALAVRLRSQPASTTIKSKAFGFCSAQVLARQGLAPPATCLGHKNSTGSTRLSR